MQKFYFYMPWRLLTVISKVLFFLTLVITISLAHVFSQTSTPISFTPIPLSDADLNAPGRGVEQWHDRNDVNVPVEGINTERLDVYYRFVWTRIEGPTAGSYSWGYFDTLVNRAIQKRQKFSFGIMSLYPGGGTEQGLVFYDGGYSSYPLYLHNLMQAESVKDWRTGTVWTPNYNSQNYQNRLLALHQAINAHIGTSSFNGIKYKDVIGYIDVRGYGAWGEWHSGYTVNNTISDYPPGTFPTVNSLKKIVDAHTQGFPDYPLVAMIAAFDAQLLENTWNPPEIAWYILTVSNNWGPIGWRRDQWGATDSYVADYLENNNRSFNGVVFKNLIMDRWKTAPINGEPPGYAPSNFSDLERQLRLYHATSFGNGNYGSKVANNIKDKIRAASKACGYRLIIENGILNVNGHQISVQLNWKNIGLAPTYEKWNVLFQLRNSNNVLAWTGQSQFDPKLFLPPSAPSTAATSITDNFSLPVNLPAGVYKLNLVIKDPSGYRGPLPLAIIGQNPDSSYTIGQIPINSLSAPSVSVINNCGSSVLTASNYTGALLWSTGETTPSITASTGGTYTVTQTINGATSSPGSGTASPKPIPLAPSVSVVNNCGSSVLTASGYSGTLLWSNGASTPSITVNVGGVYHVTQTVNGCTSNAGSGTASPQISLVQAPTVTVVNNCGNSVLTASGYTGTLLWSNGANTSFITVITPGTYTVTQTIDGCSSPAANAVASPKPIPVLTSNLAATAISGNNFTYAPSSNTTGTTFTWTRAAVPGISNAASSGSGSINEVLVNTLGSPVNVTYVYTLTAGGCSNTQNLVVTVNTESQVNCVINGSISSNFNSTSIPAGRYIWFNSSFNPGSFGTGTSTVTMSVTNSVIRFTANNQSYTLNAPNARIRFDAAVSAASTEFINNVWETIVPYNYSNYVFMSGLAYLVPADLPGRINNVTWTATLQIDKASIAIGWRWGAAVYTSFANHGGLNIKPISSNTQNPYLNADYAGTPENFKAFLVAGAKGNGGTNYTGNYSAISSATCTATVAQRSASPMLNTQPVITRSIAGLLTENRFNKELNVAVMPNPSSNYFSLFIKGSRNEPVSIRVINIFGQAIEKYQMLTDNTILHVGHQWAGGAYFVEVIQANQRKIIKLIKAN